MIPYERGEFILTNNATVHTVVYVDLDVPSREHTRIERIVL